MKCAVANCENSSKKPAAECSLFTFPVDPQLRKKWIQFCRQSKEYRFKTCYICMDHFASEDFENSLEFEMGFAKKRLLKRGAVPSIYKPFNENPERSQRVERRQNKKIVSELLRQSDASQLQAVELICDEAMVLPPMALSQAFEGNKENCSLEANRLPIVPALQGSLEKRYISVEEMEDLQAKLETLQKENSSLRKENAKLKSEVTTLQRNHWLKEKKNAYNMDVIKSVLSYAVRHFLIYWNENFFVASIVFLLVISGEWINYGYDHDIIIYQAVLTFLLKTKNCQYI